MYQGISNVLQCNNVLLHTSEDDTRVSVGWYLSHVYTRLTATHGEVYGTTFTRKHSTDTAYTGAVYWYKLYCIHCQYTLYTVSRLQY